MLQSQSLQLYRCRALPDVVQAHRLYYCTAQGYFFNSRGRNARGIDLALTLQFECKVTQHNCIITANDARNPKHHHLFLQYKSFDCELTLKKP